MFALLCVCVWRCCYCALVQKWCVHHHWQWQAISHSKMWTHTGTQTPIYCRHVNIHTESIFLLFLDVSPSVSICVFSISFTCVMPTAHFQSLSPLSSISLLGSSPLSPLIDADIKSIISLFFCPFVCLRFFARMALAGRGRTMKIDGVSLAFMRKGEEEWEKREGTGR